MEDEFEKSNSIHKINRDSLNIVFNSTIDNYKAEHLNKISKELYNHIDSLKSELLPYFKYLKDDKKVVDQLFFNSNGYTLIGQEFVNNVECYKTEMKSLFGEELQNIIDLLFNDREDIDDWLDYNFKGFPAIAVYTKLINIQNDIIKVRDNLLTSMKEKE